MQYTLVIDSDTKEAFEKVYGMLTDMNEATQAGFADLRSEIKRLDVKIDAIPDKTDSIYAGTYHQWHSRTITNR